MFDIIPDIHGQSVKLSAMLANLGWRRRPSGWVCDAPERQLIFLGDFIDRGPDNAGVLALVRSLVDAGKAQAVMGNHELNAIHFHTRGEDGKPLRAHSAKNLNQHAAFLAEFTEGASHTRDAVTWMQSLPLFIETDGLRAVHACWDERMIASLREQTRNGVLAEAQFHQAADKAHPLHTVVETLTKGPEHPLPDGYSFTDKDGTVRREVRLAWWIQADRWRDIAVSVPDPDDLPDAALPRSVQAQCYTVHAPPVVFGHYWLTGTPVLQSQNALCLDYSAGRDGEPLVAYRMDEPAAPLDLGRIVSVNV